MSKLPLWSELIRDMSPAHLNEATQRPIRVGDYVHAGFAVKGGAGFSGRVDKIDGNHVYVNVSKDKSVVFKDDPLTKWGDRIIKAPIKNVSLQEVDDTPEAATEDDITEGTTLRDLLSGYDLTEAEDAASPLVPLRLQAAIIIAKTLGSVRGAGTQQVDFKPAGSTPEAIVNQAVRVWLTGSHTNEGWALGAKMLKLAKQVGIKWDTSILKGKMGPITIKKLGLEEAAEGDTQYQEYFRAQLKKHGYDSPEDIPADKKDDFFNAVDAGYSAKNEAVGTQQPLSALDKLRQRQQQEKDAMDVRHEQEQLAQQERDNAEKHRQQQIKRNA